MTIEKSHGVTPTEQRLSSLCERTFLKLWAWPNPYNQDRKEFCDALAVFGEHVFIFFDRANQALQAGDKDLQVTWVRWKKDVIDKQIKTATGAERYLKRGLPIYIDERCERPFPVTLPENPIIHKIIVAHGAEQVCLGASQSNVTGSLGVAYEDPTRSPRFPSEAQFVVQLDKTSPVHVLDGDSLELLLTELDTFADFTAYLTEKEATIRKRDTLIYCGEEDLLAWYFRNFDESQSKYRIDTVNPDVNILWIEEGAWKRFAEQGHAERRRQANQESYLWDDLIQKSYQHALDGTIGGDSPWVKDNPLTEMAKEHRLSRRALSQHIIQAINTFPSTNQGVTYKACYMSSLSEPEKMYVFLQLKCPDVNREENREKRQYLLNVACGVTRNNFPNITTVVGIAMDPPKFAPTISEDFLLLKCAEWSEEDRAYYERANEDFNFFQNVRRFEGRVVDFE